MFPRCANMALDQVGKLEAAWYKISHVTVLAVFRFHLFLNPAELFVNCVTGTHLNIL